MVGLLALPGGMGWGQLPDKAFQHITEQDGLTSNAVFSLMQDERGFIWIGTNLGLNRYDGYNVKKWRWALTDTLALPHDEIYWTFEGSDQRIWLDTRGPLIIYHPKLNYFDRTLRNEDVQWRDDIPDIVGDSIRFWEIKGEKIKNIFPYWIYRYDYSILEMKDSTIWIATDSSIVIVNSKSDSSQIIQHIGDKILPASARSNVQILHEDQDGKVWLSTREGIGFFDPTNTLFRWVLPDIPLKSREMVLFHSKGEIWVCHEGVIIIDPESGQKEHYKHDPFAHNALSSNNTNCIIEDDLGRVWIGTRDKGINFWDPYQPNMINLKKNPFLSNTLSSNTIINAFEQGNKVWIATWDEFINCYDPSSGKFKRYRTADNQSQKWFMNPSYPTRNISDSTLTLLQVEGAGNLSTLYFDRLSESFNKIFTSELPFAPPPFTELIPKLKTSEGKVLYGSYAGGMRERGQHFEVGLIVYDPEKKHAQRYKSNLNNPDSLYGNYINNILEYSLDSSIWIGTRRGLNRFEPKKEKFTQFKPDLANPSALSTDNTGATGMREDKNHNIWIGHSLTGGIDIIPAEALRKDSIYFIRKNTSNSNLPSNEIRGITEDDNRNIWVGTPQGIAKYSFALDDFDQFRLSNKESINLSFGPLSSPNGRFFIGTHNDGLFYFHPDSIRANTTPPRIHITDLTINNQPVPLRGMPGDTLDWETPLDSTVLFTEAIELAYAQNDFSLSFVALNYTYPERTRYKYQLEGYDKDWIETTPEDAKATYTNIPHGDYTFRVIACNSDGVWNEEGDTMAISIQAPWWLTPWAYLGYLLFLGGLITGIVRWRTYALQRQRAELRARVNEQTQELKESNEQLRVAKAEAEEANQAKSNFLSFVSHELRTPLTSIIGFANLNKRRLEEKLFPLIPKTDKKVEHTIQQVSQNEAIIVQEGQRLADLINDLLDLAKIESGTVEWHMAEIAPKDLISRTVSSTEGLFTEKPDLTLVTQVDPDLPTITGDFDRLLQVLLNLVSNAVKFTHSGEVRIHVQQDMPTSLANGSSTLLHSSSSLLILFSVTDTGAGIPTEYQDKIFERFRQVDGQQEGKPKGTGLGLPICKEIVEHHRGRIWVESSVGQGSTFYFTVPVEKTPTTASENT